MKSIQPGSKSPMRLGVHVSIAGRLSKAVERAEALGCTTMQIFSRSPRGWAVPDMDPEEIKRFRELREKADIRPLAIHASYLINLASSQPALFERSVAAVWEELNRADLLGAEYLVVHVGSCSGEPAHVGMGRVVKALQQIRKQGNRSTQLLLENTAGEQGDIGWRLEELGAILKGIEDHSIGICLDTCHLFAAGYDISHRAGVDEIGKKIENEIGSQYLKLIHVNDSKKGLNCRVDRHQHIGQGGIGLEGFRAWVNHPAFRDIPMVLETPKDSPTADPQNLKTILSLRVE